jgi:hypothetical protein
MKPVDLPLPGMPFSLCAAVDCYIKNGYIYTTHIYIKTERKAYYSL